MVMGFILPFALMFVAIPLETFVGSARNVLGAGLALTLRGAAFGLRLAGNAAQAVGELLVNLYDVVIFLPLWAERKWRRRGAAAGPVNESVAPVPPANLDTVIAEPVEEEVLS
jgi:hypothetical protein